MKYLMRQQFKSEGIAPDYVRRAVADIVQANIGTELVITVAKATKYSSDPQRQYYFGVIVEELARVFRHYTGDNWDKDDTHEYLMEHVGGFMVPFKAVDGSVNKRRRSYTGLSTVETEEYHTKCRAFAAKWGSDILEPNEVPTKQYHLAG